PSRPPPLPLFPYTTLFRSRAVGVHQEREDGMVEGGGRDLDLPALLKLAVYRDHGAQQPVLLRHHRLDVGLREVPPLLYKAVNPDRLPRRQLHRPITELLTEPRQIEPHLQVAQVLLAEGLTFAPLNE